MLKNNRMVLQRYIRIIYTYIYIYIVKQSLYLYIYIYIDLQIALEQVTQRGWGTCQGFQGWARGSHGWLDLRWWWSCSDSEDWNLWSPAVFSKQHFYDFTALKYPLQILSRKLKSVLILHFQKSLNYVLLIFRWARLWHLNYQPSNELQGASLNPHAVSARCAIHLRGNNNVAVTWLSGKMRAKLGFSTSIPFSEPYCQGYAVISKWECDFWTKKIHSIC